MIHQKQILSWRYYENVIDEIYRLKYLQLTRL